MEKLKCFSFVKITSFNPTEVSQLHYCRAQAHFYRPKLLKVEFSFFKKSSISKLNLQIFKRNKTVIYTAFLFHPTTQPHQGIRKPNHTITQEPRSTHPSKALTALLEIHCPNSIAIISKFQDFPNTKYSSLLSTKTAKMVWKRQRFSI